MSATLANAADARLFEQLDRDLGFTEGEVRGLAEFAAAVGGCACGADATTVRILVADWSGETDDLAEHRVCGDCYHAAAWES